MVSRFDRRHWFKRAKEMRALAEDMPDARTKETTLRTAKQYEILAKHAVDSKRGKKD